NMRMDWLVLKSIKISQIRHDLALISLTTLLPVFVLAIRWSSTFGDSSRIGTSLVNYMIHLVNAVIFGVLMWVMFDPAFSPRRLVMDMSISAPALPLYFLVALCIGYFCGYFLLVFGK